MLAVLILLCNTETKSFQLSTKRFINNQLLTVNFNHFGLWSSSPRHHVMGDIFEHLCTEAV